MTFNQIYLFLLILCCIGIVLVVRFADVIDGIAY
jgi:hypothetical protein